MSAYRDLGMRAANEQYVIGLSCHHCRVNWVGCAAASDCPECGALKGYHGDDANRCYCEDCERARAAQGGSDGK